MTGRILIFWVLAFGTGVGLHHWNAHLIAQGDTQGAKRVQSAWDQEKATRLAEEAQARMHAEDAARKAEQAKQIETERIAHETAQREASLRAAVAAADARQHSLLTTIAQLNADAAARLSDPGAPACTAADVDEAATARELLGECSGRYAAMAGAADGLAGQVMGLQDYVRSVTTTKEPGDGV